jgi:hypothetical protein
MVDDVRLVDELGQPLLLDNRSPVRPESRRGGHRGQVLHLAGGEIVDDGHVVALRDERRGQVRTDEPRATRDQCFHLLRRYLLAVMDGS